MTTPSTYPPHLACLLCKPPVEFHTFWDLNVHYYRLHLLVMDPTICTCGHRFGSHNPAPTKRYCQAADPAPCPCRQYEQRREAA